MRTFWLSMHVPYACRDSGVCCSSGWAIPLERVRVGAVGAIRSDTSWLLPAAGAPEDVAGVLAVSASGHCVFHRDGCEIHRTVGHGALPTACQHFPREILIDPRGVFVTLSHYCPTAADLLFTHAGPVEIVEGPPAVPDGDPEGLDARDVLPPLLTEGVLMDLEGYSAWEAHMVRVLTRDDEAPPEAALDALEGDFAILQRWRPGGETLAAAVAALTGRGQAATSGAWSLPQHQPALADHVIIRRYLAARAFASWAAYQTAGVSAVIRSLREVLALLREHHARTPLKEAIRQTDLQVMHLLPRIGLASA